MKKHWLVLVSVMAALSVGCTISFSNIDTHGTSDQIGDEEQTATPTITPVVNLPSPL